MVQNDLLSLHYLSAAETKQALTSEPLRVTVEPGSMCLSGIRRQTGVSSSVFIVNLSPSFTYSCYFFHEKFQLKQSFKALLLNFIAMSLRLKTWCDIASKKCHIIQKNVLFLRVSDAQCEVKKPHHLMLAFLVSFVVFLNVMSSMHDTVSKNVFLMLIYSLWHFHFWAIAKPQLPRDRYCNHCEFKAWKCFTFALKIKTLTELLVQSCVNTIIYWTSSSELQDVLLETHIYV